MSEINLTDDETPVSSYYRGKTIFLTGGSGFMGKVMLEKLLYACPGIETVYLLLRNKRGKSPQQRIENLWKLPMFERLRESQPHAIKKIKALTGDVNTEGLGMKISDLDILCSEVNIVFHMAATLKLEAKLKDAVEQNTAGTSRVIEVCRRIRNLEAFLHFSTAFCSADVDIFEEKIYENRDNPKDVMELTKWLKDQALEVATPSIIAPHPNTYTYSKRLAETLVADEKDYMPVCIVRPSIVIPAVSEPVPGWVDSLNGPIGLIVGAGKGVIRSMHAKGENQGQFIPVDYAINASIVIAYLVGTKQVKKNEVPVYNLTMHSVMPVTYREIIDKGRDIVHKYPFEMQIWYPDGDIRASKLVHNIYSFFYHWIPALLIDLLMFICGQKTFMIRIQKKIYDGLELLQFFSTRNWNFRSDNFVNLKKFLTKADIEKFQMLEVLPLEDYLVRALLGTRLYCLKEDLSSLPRCRRKQKLLYVIHKFAVYGFYFYIFYLLSCYFRTVKIVYDFTTTAFTYIPFIGAWFMSDELK